MEFSGVNGANGLTKAFEVGRKVGQRWGVVGQYILFYQENYYYMGVGEYGRVKTL